MSRACRHCGLAAASTGDYCCYGCELAAQIAGEGEQRKSELYGLITFCLLLSMIVMMLSLFLFAEDVYQPGADAGLLWMRKAYRVASAVLSTPVVLLLGVPLARRAWRSLGERRLTMDLLVAAGAAAAYALSIVNIVRGHVGVYFDSATSALVLTTLGRYLEASARARASRVIAPSLQLSSAPVLAAGARGEWKRVGAAEIVPGMRLEILAGEVVPVDLEICDGDEGSAGEVEVTLGVLTGAAAPVTKQRGDEVPAGAVPVSGALYGVAKRAARESTLERLAELARGLKERPSRLQRVGDAFASALVPLVTLLALGTFGLTLARASIDQAVVSSLSVVLAACPCTYGVATPLVLWLALRKGLEHGVCIRNASALEELSEVKAVAFDKTGTLTDPRLGVLSADVSGIASRAEVVALTGALEAGSKHPVAQALAVWAAGEDPEGPQGRKGHKESEGKGGGLKIVDCKSLVSRGVSARDESGRRLLLGSIQWLKDSGVVVEDEADPAAAARVGLARDGLLLARFRIGEALRPEAVAAVNALRADGIEISMLTGDTAGGAREIASKLGIQAEAALSPSDKVERLGRHGKKIAMVGDGLNDAPALAGAGPSFAMDGGTSLARGMAQVSLLRPDLRLVPWTLSLARRSMKIGYQNLVWSTVYNLVFLGLAATGTLRPVWAGLSMLTSSLLTLASSLRVSAMDGPEGGPSAMMVDDDAEMPLGSAPIAAPLEAT